MQLVIFTTLAVLVCSSVPTLASTKFITPHSSMPCPDERYCYRLQEVIHNTRVYFTSNTTLKFLPGIYNIETERSVVVSDVTGLAIVGNNTIIQCFANFGLVFLNVSNLTIQHLHFTHCGLNVISRELMISANRLTDMAHLIRDRFIPKQNLYSALYFVQVYDLSINRVIVNGSNGCGILGINILGNSSLVYSSFAGNMFNAFFIYQDLARDTSGFAAVILAIMHSNFELGITKFTDSAGGLTMKFYQNLYHVSVLINNATVRENKGITCSSVYVGTSKCSSIALEMEMVTLTGGVCMTSYSNTSGELLFLYGTIDVSCKKKPQTLYITRGNFSRNSQIRQRRHVQPTIQPTIHITAPNSTPVFVFVNMTDILLTNNMGSGLHINNIKTPVLLQSVFIADNNGGVEIRHSNVTFSGTTTLTHNRGKPFHITESNVTFTGSLCFERNKVNSACTFEVVAGSKVIFAEYTSFYGNYAGWGVANLCISSGSSVMFREGRTKFIKNQGERNGAIP